MLSKASFERMKSDNDIQVQRTEMEVFVADGKQLTLEGKIDVEMQL
jgi:hypothetical protein